MNQGRTAESSFALKSPLTDINSNSLLTSWDTQEPDNQQVDFDNTVDAAFASWDLEEQQNLAIINTFLEASDYAEDFHPRSNVTDQSIRKLLQDSRTFIGSIEDVTNRRSYELSSEESGFSHSEESSSEELSYLLQNYPHVLQNQRIADFLIDPYSGITPSVVLNSIRQRQQKEQEQERSSAGVSVDRSAIEPGYHMMAATAKHTRDKFDAGEEDIAAIAKQISDHAEAIYQTWKSRGLAPTEILNCHTPQNAADKFGPALTPQNSSATTPVTDLLAQAPNMDNNNLEKLVSNFVNEDKARIAAQRNKSPSKTIPSSIQFALQKFEKNNSPQKVTSPSSNPSFVHKNNLKSSPVKPTTPTQNPPAYSPKPAIGVKPQIAPKCFNLNQPDNLDSETIEVTYPPDIVPQKPEAPKRPAGLSLQTPANLQTWPLKNKVLEQKVQKSGTQTNNDSPQKGNYSRGATKPDKYSTLPGSPKTSSASYMDEVAREEERLINALKTGAVLGEDRDSIPFVPKTRISKKDISPVRESVKPDLIPTEKPILSKDERDGTANVNISLVDYVKTKYKDNLENPLSQQRLDTDKQLDIDRKAHLIDPSLGLQVTETRSKFEGADKIEKAAADKEGGPAVAPPGRWGGAPRTASIRRVGADQVPHPELTTQQKQHIRAQADKMVAGSPVRPFLTRGSVAERVLIFEKCPSELMLDKRKTPAITSWRTGHDVMAKAQTYGLGRCSSAPPGDRSTATAAAAAAARPTRAAHAALTAAGLPLGAGGRRAAVPRFHFPRGRPPPQSGIDQAVHKVQSAFNTFPNSQVPRESFHHIVKACDCPLYWKAPLFLATQRNLHTPVDGHKFIDYWRQVITQCHDQASRFVYILTRGASDSLGPEELAPLVQDVVDTHPGLSFLKEATEFHSRYVHTVIARIFYCVNRSWSGRITVQELRRTDLLQVLQLLEEEEDINQVTAYFSYEHFYVIYCKFWELDRDHDLFIDKQDLARHNDHALSSRMIERVVSGCVTRGSRRTNQREGDDPRMSYTEFVWFLLAEEDKQHPTAIEYWFRCMDLDGDGYLSMYELEYFYEEQMHRMEAIGIETLPFQDCLCQMLDMVQPAIRDKITLSDLKRCKMTPIFFDTFFNLEKYLDHEQRDPFASQRDHDSEGRELSEWDRFAAEEYELLVAEEGGSDAQEQVSYDETDDDCLSPNLDEILSTEVIEEASIMCVGSPKSPLFSPTKMDAHPDTAGYVNLTSLYKTSPHEKAVLSKPGDPYFKNGYLDRQSQSPTSPKSLNLNSMKMERSNDGNNSFLYSHLLSPQRQSPESENGRTGGIYANLLNDTLKSSVDFSKQYSGLGDSALSRLAFPGGINRMSDNYEKAIGNKIPQKEISAMNRVGIFNKDSLKSPKKAKVSPSYKDEDDEDYARDSDECSI